MKCFLQISMAAIAYIFIANQLIGQTSPHAAILDAARIMNFVDEWNRNNSNGNNNNAVRPGKLIPESFYEDVPFYAVEDYSVFQGTYRGKTWNRSANKFGDTWLTLGDINYNNGTICLKAGWFNGLAGSVHLEAGMSESNIFTGEGTLYFNSQPMYNIHMFIFMLNYRQMKGVCVLFPLTAQGYSQCSTFVLGK